MATWLAADELDFHGAATVAGGWLRRARRLLEPLEVGPDHGWLAFHEGYVAHASGDGATGASSSGVARRRGRPALRRPRPGDARPRARGRRARGARRRSRRGCAASTRRRRRRWPARRRSRSRAPGRAASSSPRARRCTTTSGRPSGATGSPSSPSATAAATCSASAGRSTARCSVWRGRWAEAEELLRGRDRGRSPARAPHTQPARCASSPSCGGARAGRPRRSRCSRRQARPSGAQLCRARLALDAGDPRTAVGAGSSGCTATIRARARRRCWSCSCARRSPAASSTARRSALAELRDARAAGRHAAAAGVLPTWPRACSPPLATTTSAPARCSRTRSTPTSGAGAVRGGAGADRARGDPGRARPQRPRRRRDRGRRAARCRELGAVETRRERDR